MPGDRVYRMLALTMLVGLAGCTEQTADPPVVSEMEPNLVEFGRSYAYTVHGQNFLDKAVHLTEGGPAVTLDQEWAALVRLSVSPATETGASLGVVQSKDLQTLGLIGAPLPVVGMYDLRVVGPYGQSDWSADALEVTGVGECKAGSYAPLADEQAGVCAGQVKVCQGPSGWVEPDYAAIPGHEVTETACDSLDNDCDGTTDEGCSGTTWMPIPGGSCQMGSTSGANEQPAHAVNVPTFEMAKTEVTVEQYRLCVQSSGCSNPRTGGACNWGVPRRESHPVNCVTWNQAVDFCGWAGARLPSEAEWEYAARGGGNNNTYPWGSQEPSCTLAVLNKRGAGCAAGSTMAVCSKTAGNTAEGLCDLSGNAWEWVQDWYHDSYNGAPANGLAWETPVGTTRVARGGSFRNGAADLRASFRKSYDPGLEYDYVGFRCVRRFLSLVY